MNWSLLHFCVGQALGLLPQLRLEDLKVFHHIEDFSIDHLWDRPETQVLGALLEPFLSQLSVYHTIDETLQKWQSEYQILTPFSPLYPRSFYHVSTPPLLLFVQGQITWNTHFNLAVVGKREAQSHTLKWVHDEFYPFLSYEMGSLNIVSGGARGIDQKAHTGALLYQKSTTVFLPSGLDCIYPKSLLAIKESILEHQGALVSHYLPHTPMRKHNFYSRNELIAALSDACLVIEAEIRSGTYKTALYCQNLNTPLGVVPSFPLDTNYSGSLQLIYDGASVIRDRKDLSLFKALQSKSTIAIDQID